MRGYNVVVTAWGWNPKTQTRTGPYVGVIRIVARNKKEAGAKARARGYQVREVRF